MAARALELLAALGNVPAVHGGDRVTEAAASLWALSTRPDMLAAQQPTLEELLCSCEPLARHAAASVSLAHAPAMQAMVAKLLGATLFSPGALARSDALFALVGVEPAPGVAVQLASAVSCFKRAAPLNALARVLAVDRGLSDKLVEDVAKSACELSETLATPSARAAARNVLVAAVRANREAALKVALDFVNSHGSAAVAAAMRGGPCAWLSTWPACAAAPCVLMALFHLAPFREAVLSNGGGVLGGLFARLQASASVQVDATAVLECAACSDPEPVRVLAALAALAPEAARATLGGSLARRLTCDWCGSDQESEAAVSGALVASMRGCASLGDALAKRFAPRRVVDACSQCGARGHVTERVWVSDEVAAPPVIVMALSGVKTGVALDLEGLLPGYGVAGYVARRQSGAFVAVVEACNGEWLACAAGARARIVPAAEALGESDDVALRLVLLSSRAPRSVGFATAPVAGAVAATATTATTATASNETPDADALVRLAAQLVALAGPEAALTPLGQRAQNAKVVVTPPAWWPAYTPKAVASPSRAPQPRAVEQAATACIRLAVALDIEAPADAMAAVASMSTVRDQLIAWLLRSDASLARAARTPVLSAVLRGGPLDGELVRRLAKDKEYWPTLGRLVKTNPSAAQATCAVQGLLRRALHGGWLDLAASMAERMPLASRALELGGLESVVVDALCSPDGEADDGLRLAVVWPSADVAVLAARALRHAEPASWRALNAAVWSAGLATGADLLLPELYSMRRSEHAKVVACVEWLLDRCDANPDLVRELAAREPLFPREEDRVTDWVYRFLERFPRDVGGPLVPKAMALMVRLAGVHQRGDLVVGRAVRFPTEDVHVACRVACAREVEQTDSENVAVRVLDDVDQARLYFQVVNGRRHPVVVLLWFNPTGEEKFALPPDRMVVRRVAAGESAVLFAASAVAREDDDSPDWGRYEYAWEFRGDEDVDDVARRASLGGAGGAARPSLDLVQREYGKVVVVVGKASMARVSLEDEVAETSLGEFENDPDAQWIIDGLDPFACE